MMDIEKMKRVNALARELKDHGIASDFDDAYKQAEKMIESGMSVPAAAASNESVPQEGAVKASGLGLGYDALELRNLNQRLGDAEQQISMLFTKMNEMISEINRVEKKKADSPIEIRETKEAEEPNDVQTSLKKKDVEPHPRSGDYKPGDVSIEKMFYFGGGR